MIDTHCHLDFKNFDADRDAVIARAFEGGVRKMITIGCNLEEAKKNLEISKKNNFISVSVGLHPQEAGLGDEKFFSELKKLLKEPKVVAIGECGLEFTKDILPEEKEKQKEVFLKQLDLAKEFKKPVIIHCRGAYPEILEILKKEKEKNSGLFGVIHCFVGRFSQAEEFLKLGFLISFTGIITYARDYDKVIKNIPIEKMIIETDAPFIAPEPFRGKRNEPFFVKYIAEKIAELKELNFKEVAVATTKNAEDLFGI